MHKSLLLVDTKRLFKSTLGSKKRHDNPYIVTSDMNDVELVIQNDSMWHEFSYY
jgi:hypothetical protein